MTKKDASAAHLATQSTEAALADLASHIQRLVSDEVLDSRCAAKLVKRLRKEGVTVSTAGTGSEADREALIRALDALETALFDQNAVLLVAANATLREIDAEREGEQRQRRSPATPAS
jgi:hypothetical protein